MTKARGCGIRRAAGWAPKAKSRRAGRLSPATLSASTAGEHRRTCSASACGDRTGEQEIARQLTQVEAIRDERFPVEQARLLQLLIKQVVVTEEGLDVRMHADGLYSLRAELQGEA